MRASIHPEYQLLKVTCSCGNTFETRSTLTGGSLSVEICSSCHPFYTGQQKSATSGGRVQRFRDRYKLSSTTNQKSEQDSARG